jgi:hypothetical protein
MRTVLRVALTLGLVSSSNIWISPAAQATYSFTSHTFTNCSATGVSGPTQSACRSAYVTTWDETSNFTVVSGIQFWVVPYSGMFRITAIGAGGASPGGNGASMRGDFSLTGGSVIKILVGQAGSSGYGGGGGGGTFVATNANSPLIVGGGGGGRNYNSTQSGTNASTVHNPSSSSGDATAPNGSGGCGMNGGGGAGFNSDGSAGAKSFINGGSGGTTQTGHCVTVAPGGFGGGGGGGNGGGGGGGYFGGAPGANSGVYPGGSGGGSFNSGTNQVNTLANNVAAAGSVTIVSLGPSLNSFVPRTTLTNSSSITYDITFSESVSGLAANDFSLSGAGSSTCAIGTPSGSGTTYTVALSGCSPGTIILTMAANAVANSSSQNAPASNTAAATVTIDQTAPTITSVSAPANNTYIPTNTPAFTMVFSESVTVTGTPRLTLTVGSQTRYANYISMSDSRTALFRYTVALSADDFDTDGIAVATTVDLNSGTIQDLATNAISNLTFSAPTLTSVLVAQPPAAPTIESITATSGALSIAFTPGATRGAAITNYEISTNNGVNWTTRSPVATTSPISISGLTNGQLYNVRLRAINAAGTSDSSTAVAATPTAISVSGDTTLTLTYGNSASTGAYSATGGTNTYTWSLGSTLTGISISGSTVTASSSTPAGTYSQTVRATDGNSQVGTRALTITVNRANTFISIALPSSATSAALGGAVTITATVSRAGSVNFQLGGVSLAGCSAAAAASTTATCSWTPASLGSVALTAIFTPTDSSNFNDATSSPLNITVVNGVSTISLSLAGGVTQVAKGQSINIIAAIDQVGRVTFLIDGKRIPGCFNLRVAAIGNRNCSWKPAVQKAINISARLVPTNNVFNPSTANMNVQVVRRTGTR